MGGGRGREKWIDDGSHLRTTGRDFVDLYAREKAGGGDEGKGKGKEKEKEKEKEISFHPPTSRKPRAAGDEWLFCGPATYIPQVQVQIMETVEAIILKANTLPRTLAYALTPPFPSQTKHSG